MAQAPLLPPPEEVNENLAYIPITPKILMKAPRADSGCTISSKTRVTKTIEIAPSYRETIAGQRVKVLRNPSKTGR